jgi:hypothetical protein
MAVVRLETPLAMVLPAPEPIALAIVIQATMWLGLLTWKLAALARGSVARVLISNADEKPVASVKRFTATSARTNSAPRRLQLRPD